MPAARPTTSNVGIDEHPVLATGQLSFKTHAIQRLHEDIQRWVWTGVTGGLVYGSTRVGKSKSLDQITQGLCTRGGVQVPAFKMEAKDRDANTIASVFRNLAYSVGLPVRNRDTADHLSERFTHYVVDTAIDRQCNKAVLFVDEMQNLTLPQFNAFAEIYNRLARFDISLTTVFIGNDPQCWRLVEATESSSYAHIHGRFFRQGSPFMGLLSESDVRYILEQYDELRHPKDGPTYTGFFLPDAVSQGWRLASLSGSLWQAFGRYKDEYRIASWPMQFFIQGVNILLADFLPHYGVENADDGMLDEAIRTAGLLPSLVHYEA